MGTKQHSHDGLPSAARYAQGCRAKECLDAVYEYRRRYQARKDAGIYHNLRKGENRRNWAAEAIQLPRHPENTDEQRAVLANRHTALVELAALAEADGYVPPAALVILGASAQAVVAELAGAGLVQVAGDADVFLDFPMPSPDGYLDAPGNVVEDILGDLPEDTKVPTQEKTESFFAELQNRLAAQIQNQMGPVADDPVQTVHRAVTEHVPDLAPEKPAPVQLPPDGNYGTRTGMVGEEILRMAYNAVVKPAPEPAPEPAPAPKPFKRPGAGFYANAFGSNPVPRG